MALSRDNDYSMYLYTCNRCRSCTMDKSDLQRPVCPSYAKFGYFSYSGGGKGYVGQGIIEKKVKPSVETAEIAMNCVMCGACQSACPPGFDINAFIRDLRDHVVKKGIYLNDAHKKILDNMDSFGNPFKKKLPDSEAPVFKEGMDILVWRGCNDRLTNAILDPVLKILEKAGMSWGVLENEPCCGSPYLELGDKDAFEKSALKVLETIEKSGAERMLLLCPHCASTMMVDYFEVGDIEVEPLTVPTLLSELIGDEKITLKSNADMKVTFHDPCRLARWLEETDTPREVLDALGVELVEMERSGEFGWCCGGGSFAHQIVPDLANYTAKERIKEARQTGADTIVTACSYCNSFLKRKSGTKQKVVHLADLVAQNI
jgi:heterodisulfide reductase subunit D